MSKKSTILLVGVVGIFVCSAVLAWTFSPSYLGINVSQIQQEPYDFEGTGWVTMNNCNSYPYKAHVYQWDTSGYMDSMDLVGADTRHYTSSQNPVTDLGTPTSGQIVFAVVLFQNANEYTLTQITVWEESVSDNDQIDSGETYQTYAITGY